MFFCECSCLSLSHFSWMLYMTWYACSDVMLISFLIKLCPLGWFSENSSFLKTLSDKNLWSEDPHIYTYSISENNIENTVSEKYLCYAGQTDEHRDLAPWPCELKPIRKLLVHNHVFSSGPWFLSQGQIRSTNFFRKGSCDGAKSTET